MSAFVLSKIFPSMSIDASQRFIFGLEESPEPLGSFKLDNIFVPTLGSPSQTNSEMRNEALSGYRWIHETASDETYGSFRLQKFLEGSPTGIDLVTFNDDGSFIIPGTTDAKYILQTAHANLPNAQSLGALTTGLLKNTVTAGTGVLSTAVIGTDYYEPNGDDNIIIQTPNGAISYFQVGEASEYIRLGYDGTSSRSFINFVSHVGLRFQNNGTNIGGFLNSSHPTFTVGGDPQSQATILAIGGVQQVTGEDSSIRATGNSIATKIELHNFALPDGKLYEIRSNSNGTLSIFNRTTTHERFILNNDGSISCNGATSGSAQFIALNNDVTSGTSGYVWKTGANTRATFYHSEVNNELILTAITGGMPIIFGTNNLEKMRLNSTGNLGIGDNNPTLARLQVSGGVTNVASEESIARFTGGLNAAKIELQCTNGSGKLYELRSDNAGAFGIFDRTGTASRLSFDTNGILSVFKNVLISTASSSDVPLYQVGHNTDFIQLGYDGPNDYSFINIDGPSNDRLAFRVGGTGIAAFLASGLFGFGLITPTQAKVVVSGGVQNVANEDSIIRGLSSANVGKIELQCTNGSGKNFELRSDNSGAFSIFDRTGAASRLFINTSGNIGIGTTTANALLQLNNTVASRKFVIFEAGNNNHQVKGLGHDTDVFRFQTNQTGDSFVFYAGVNSTTSNEVARISGVGTFTTLKIQGSTSNVPGAAAGSAAGSSPTLSFTGGEISGTFSVTAGSTPSGTLIATITLDVAMASVNYGVVFTPANQATASLATDTWINVTSTTQFTVNNATALVNGTVYKWNYHILGV